jgi:type IV secretion system protein VirB10
LRRFRNQTGEDEMVRDALPPPRSGLDPSFDVDAPPRVGGNPTLWPVVFGTLGALGLGAIVFLNLNANRARADEAKLTDAAPMAQPLSNAGIPPAPDMSAFYQPPPPPAPEPVPEVELLPPPATGPTQADIDRLRAPALVVDLSEYKTPAAGPAPPTGNPLDPAAVAGTMTGAANAGSASPDERFAQRFGVGGTASKSAQAVPMGDLSMRIIEGAVIPAVLETALNSDLPGYARAVVTRDVRGFNGSHVLVPRGSRLIGQYKAGVALGQSRAFVIWTRLIRPDGATVELSSPATDALGRGGLDGDVDRHFFQRFGGAILLSLLNIGGSAISDSTDTTVVIAGARAGQDAVGSTFAADAQIGPTVKVPQGSPVRVFVSQDIDFSAVGPANAAD